MRVYSDIDEERNRLVVGYAGQVTLHDITEMTRTSSAAGMLHFQLLADMRLGTMTLEGDDWAGFAALVRKLALGSRLGQTAVLVASLPDLEAAKRITELAAGLCDVRGFLDRTEAERWLGWV